jgi:Peptidase family M28
MQPISSPSTATRGRCLLALLALSAFMAPVRAVDQNLTDQSIHELLARVDVTHYQHTLKELTRFGDRRQGTTRNRQALDWIEAQLKSYGCADVERLTYDYKDGDSKHYSIPASTAFPNAQVGGARMRGHINPTGVNNAAERQPDARLRALNAEPATPGERQEVYCTKVGDTHPEQMYIVGAHMDGIGYGEAANDDGSGTALVLELARLYSATDVHTDVSIRFVLWNNEETGLNGAYAYVAQRAALQGIENPPGSKHYPEPTWLGMIQHDMLLFDHGMPLKDGTIPAHQRPEADINVEFQSSAKLAYESQALAWRWQQANEAFASDYPVSVGAHMTNTDSTPFMNLVPAISVRENERGRDIGAGWDPHWHQPTDVYASFDDDDFRLGFNALQTTLGGVGRLVAVRVVHPH